MGVHCGSCLISTGGGPEKGPLLPPLPPLVLDLDADPGGSAADGAALLNGPAITCAGRGGSRNGQGSALVPDVAATTGRDIGTGTGTGTAAGAAGLEWATAAASADMDEPALSGTVAVVVGRGGCDSGGWGGCGGCGGLGFLDCSPPFLCE